MAGCCDNFSMIDGGDEFKAFPGLKGEDGTTYYPHVSTDGILSWTNDGGKTNPDPVDISGPPGRSVEMRGPVASVSDLPTTAPSDELWLVGSTSPYDGWFYNGTSWQNIGQISVGPQGPQGEQGEQGEDGFSPTISTNEVSGGCFITITDATGTETVFLANGASAGFGTPTATVDANVGTPSVEVTASGPNTAKVFSFAFHNLKGEPGGGGGGTSNYNDLSNKPQIQGVTLSGNKTASDLGLALSANVPTKTSDLTNDSGFVNAAGAAAAAPVQSVNGSTGAVTVQSKITASGLLKGDGSGGVSAAAAGTDYQAPLTAGTDYETPVKAGSVALSASWTGSGPYTQTVTVTGATVTANSKIDLQPTAAQIADLIAAGVTGLVIENNAGTLTAYAVGGSTGSAMTIQCTVTEVAA